MTNLRTILGTPLCEALDIDNARVEIDDAQMRTATLAATVRNASAEALTTFVGAPAISIGERRPDDGSGTVIGIVKGPA